MTRSHSDTRHAPLPGWLAIGFALALALPFSSLDVFGRDEAQQFTVSRATDRGEFFVGQWQITAASPKDDGVMHARVERTWGFLRVVAHDVDFQPSRIGALSESRGESSDEGLAR